MTQSTKVISQFHFDSNCEVWDEDSAETTVVLPLKVILGIQIFVIFFISRNKFPCKLLCHSLAHFGVLLLDWMFVFLQNLYVEILTHNVMVVKDGAFRRDLRLDKVMRVKLHGMISVLKKRERDRQKRSWTIWFHSRGI